MIGTSAIGMCGLWLYCATVHHSCPEMQSFLTELSTALPEVCLPVNRDFSMWDCIALLKPLTLLDVELNIPVS